MPEETLFVQGESRNDVTTQDAAVAPSGTFGSFGRTTYRHGHVPEALRAAARDVLERDDFEGVGLRELSRRVGVSATAAYRHFASKDDLMASVAAEGFEELGAALELAAREPDSATAIGLAYVEFALTKRGLFRLMFGPLLARKGEHPKLHVAAAAAFEIVLRSDVVGNPSEGQEDAARLAAWGLIHGLSTLFIDNLMPERNVRPMAAEILKNAKNLSHHSGGELVMAE
jgi:AcrR family transcriptional regulator